MIAAMNVKKQSGSTFKKISLINNVIVGCFAERLFLKKYSVCELFLSNKDRKPNKDHFFVIAMYRNGEKDLDSHTSRYLNT